MPLLAYEACVLQVEGELRLDFRVGIVVSFTVPLDGWLGAAGLSSPQHLEVVDLCFTVLRRSLVCRKVVRA